MRVCLDARCVRQTVTGLGRYAECLVRALAEIDRQNEYLVLLNDRYPHSIIEQENFVEVRLPGRPDTVGNFLVGARRIGRLHYDVYHSLHHFLPFGIRGRAMLTLHDLIWLEHPSLAFPNRWKGRVVHAYAKVTMGYSLRRADHIIAISHSTALRAQALMGMEPSRISVIPHGIDERFLRAGDEPIEPNVDGPPYFLVLGHSKPYKNVSRVIGALALLSVRLPDVTVRIVGRGEGYRELEAQAERLGVRDRVVFMEQIPDEELFGVMRRAVALVFPSLVEGFGMPILEAQALGCPVITSDRGAPAEVGGDAALLVDPTDSWEIAEAMERICRDERLRDELITKGRARAEKFTWRATATRTREVYERLIGQKDDLSHIVRAQKTKVTTS